MNKYEFYTCNRCNSNIPKILKGIHKIKCKSVMTLRNKKPSSEADQESYLKEKLLNQIEIIRSSRNYQEQNETSNRNQIFEETKKIESENQNFQISSNYQTSITNSINFELVSTNSMSFISNTSIHDFTHENNIIESHLAYHDLSSGSNYDIDFEKMEKNLEGKDIVIHINSAKEISEKIYHHFKKIAISLHKIANNSSINNDIKVNYELSKRIKRHYLEICNYIKEDQSKLKEIIEGELSDFQEIQIETKSFVKILKRGYENFYELRKLLENSKPSLAEVELVLPLIGIHPLNQNIVSCLPENTFNENDKLALEKTNCVICQYNFEENEKIITLPCMHIYHPQCVKKWFLMNNTCPICKLIVSDNL